MTARSKAWNVVRDHTDHHFEDAYLPFRLALGRVDEAFREWRDADRASSGGADNREDWLRMWNVLVRSLDDLGHPYRVWFDSAQGLFFAYERAKEVEAGASEEPSAPAPR